MKETYTIDATGRAIGRVATEAALCLLGKRTPDFKKHLVKALNVKIINSGKLKISQKKMRDKVYKRYSGYPGGLKEKTLSLVIAKKGIAEALTHAVRGMLPKNKLQDRRMKNLVIVE